MTVEDVPGLLSGGRPGQIMLGPVERVDAIERLTLFDTIADPKACAIRLEQIARVGSPEPSAIMRRRQRAGTGGCGRK